MRTCKPTNPSSVLTLIYRSSLTWDIHNDRMPWRGWTQEEAYIAPKNVCRAMFVIMLKDNMGFPGSSAGKESTCNAGDPSLIPRVGRPNGEGIGYPLQDSWASLVAQTVKNPPAMQETWVQSLGWDDFLEEGMATHSSILVYRVPMDRGAWRAIVHGVTKSQTRLSK